MSSLCAMYVQVEIEVVLKRKFLMASAAWKIKGKYLSIEEIRQRL